MINKVTIEELKLFEKDIYNLYKQKKIMSPIHLRGGNEQQLKDIFKNIKEEDFCFFTWASHLECLLKGVPPEEVKKSILNNKSIALSFKKYNIFSSAIVGGNAPLAIGMALSFKLKKENRHVYCFMGDMSFYTGIVQESLRFAEVNNLPITFIIADNKKSVETPTREFWGDDIDTICKNSKKCIKYEYTNIYPHAGIGEKIIF